MSFPEQPQGEVAMKLACPSCHRELEFVRDRPFFCAYCGQALRESTVEYDPNAATQPPSDSCARASDSVPEMVAGYRLLRPLGTGGMGTVYEAVDVTSERHVALKLVSSEFAHSTDAVDRFRQEGRLASMIVHPRCVFVLTADECAGQPYIVMELMPGKTLQDLGQERGPLPVEEAVAKIMDVIEGLQEAHQLGVIHRDVKPSNCFVEADGRVKVGDFGLAKSLIADQHLTRTGLFLGTPLYASPEQVKAERVDQRTDVYSVAATLYFLLTGRAPFQSRDAAATVARIVSDSPPSLRTLRPHIPASLEKIVLRGLERERQRRWRNLDEFQAALLPFLSTQLSVGRPALRMAAFLIDYGLFLPLVAIADTNITNKLWPMAHPLRRTLVSTIPWVIYFLILESAGGCSLGKRWLGLRVYSASGNYTPGMTKVLLRTLLFYALFSLPAEVLSFAYDIRPAQFMEVIAYGLVPIAGILIMVAPMRARNGYRGVHELFSGTRVVRLPWTKKRRAFQNCPAEQVLSHPDGLPDRVGAYRVQGSVHWTAELGILAGQDPALGRKVWIYLRPLSSPALNAERRETNRPTRLPWLTCGKHEEMQWDAFLAPGGCPLPYALSKETRLSWPDARSILEQLSDELVAACRDKTLPRSLTVDGIWAQVNGRVQLVETQLDPPGNWPNGSANSDQDAALLLLRQVAELTLEGRARPAEQPATAIQAPVPRHAGPLLDRLLLADGPPFGSVKEFCAELAGTRDQPQEVTSDQRAAHLALSTAAFFLPLVMMFGMPLLTTVMVKFTAIVALEVQIRDEQRVRGTLQDGMQRDFLFALFQPNPLIRADGFARLHSDIHLSHLLDEKVEREAVLEHKLRRSAGRVTSAWLEFLPPEDLPLTKQPLDFRRAAEEATTPAENPFHEFFEDYGWVLAMIYPLPFPLIWVVWAVALRGGITLRLAGIALLRCNGRKALRIQCAWRALLVWMPVAALLAISIWLDGVWLRAWLRQDLHLYEWAYWLSWFGWSLALALLPLYVGLALWLPNRGLHDRLAGTYLVPR
jgi:hypothetical protein